MTTHPARESERYLAGCALHGADTAADVLAAAPPDLFLDPLARGVMQACAALLRDGRETTAADVMMWFTAADRRAELGPQPGPALAELLDAAPTAATVGHAAARVREWAGRRRLHALAAELGHRAVNPDGPLDELVAEADRRLHQVTADEDGGPIAAAAAVADALDRYQRRPPAAIATGLDPLDRALSGGVRGGELVLIGARPGGGKSALALAIAAGAARGGPGVLFFGLEMPTPETVDRLLAAEADVPLPRLRGHGTLDPAHADRLAAEQHPDRTAGLPLWFDDRADSSVARIAAVTRRFVRRHGVRAIVVDYLQLVRPDDRRAPRYEQVGAISRGLKVMAKECGVAVLAGVQLNRDADSTEPPRLSHLRESGSLEQDADAVLLLHPIADPLDPNGTRPTADFDLLVAKQRNGPAGIAIPLAFDRAYVRFWARPAR